MQHARSTAKQLSAFFMFSEGFDSFESNSKGSGLLLTFSEGSELNGLSSLFTCTEDFESNAKKDQAIFAHFLRTLNQMDQSPDSQF